VRNGKNAKKGDEKKEREEGRISKRNCGRTKVD
jgi:hypothetical protein